MPQQSDGILVVGAGISGIRSALDLAETGRRVILIDRAAHIGGVLSQLDNQFPSDHCGMCRLLPSLDRDAGSQFCLRKGFYHDNIEIHPATELSDLSGEAGKFSVRLRRKTQWVDPDLCSGCGLCESVCPVEVPDLFNGGLGLRKAIHRPMPHAVPQPYVIDEAVCTRCGLCEGVCPTQAIRLAGDGRSSFRILVVDDEFAVRDSLREWMVNEGFASVELAASGQEALEILEKQSYQLMLVDVKMPGMDGVELLKQAKDRYPELTVIMMTAYATVETAVEAMKFGAMDYFMKPFDPQVMIPLVVQTYEKHQAGQDRERMVSAVILATGTGYFDPAAGVNPYGLGKTPHVVTNLQFERMLSAAGPTGGRLMRPATGDAAAKPIAKIAWMQCVGSRDIQSQADFCSAICCMASIKEGLLAKEKSGSRIDTVIYHMDMRTAGKSFQRYRDRAAARDGVRFERARVHSIRSDLQTGDPVIRTMALDGSLKEEAVDLVVLAVGQRPSPGTAELAEKAQLQLNPWGFLESLAFYPARSSRSGIFLSGGTSGLKGIGESVIQASAAALEAGFVDRAGGDDNPAAGKTPIPVSESLSQDLPATMAVLCTCQGRLESVMSRDRLTSHLMRDPAVCEVAFSESLCIDAGWQQIQALMSESHANRLLIGACHPLRFAARRTRLAQDIGLPTRLMAAVDLAICDLPAPGSGQETASGCRPGPQGRLAALDMALAGLKHAEPDLLPETPVTRRALVVGGGIAGMQAALGMAREGVEVDLVEKSHRLGGNLHWLQHTLDGDAVAPFLAETTVAVEQHPLIQCRLNSRVIDIFGTTGDFHATVETRDETPADSEPPANGDLNHLSHGVVVLATGGREAAADQYGYGSHGAVVTQKEVEERLGSGELDPRSLNTVVMIQCVGSRQPPRNFCSRICCPTALKHALALKKENPDIAVYILYRDMMTRGFVETYYTQARRAGVIFIQYTPEHPPRVEAEQEQVTVRVHDPILDLPLEIKTDMLELAVGITPTPAGQLVAAMGIAADEDGFFEEADTKWRPVESIREGIFACGLSLAPGTIAEAVLGGQAAAQRAMRILTRSSLPAGTTSAWVRTSLCALCRRCIDTCPYAARWIDEEVQQVVVHPAMCQGCGACAAVCPNGAAVLAGYDKHRVLDMIDAAFTA